jgi:hypothetical protein
MPSSPLECPLPKDLNVKTARDRYLAENGFSVEGYDAKWTEASFFGLNFSVPNTKHHRWAIMRHDLHHAATGYGTDLVGEAEISAWEIRKGFRGLGLYVGSIVAGAALFGLVIAPRRTLAAFRASAAQPSLFQSTLSYESLMAMNLAQLRDALGVAPDGVAAHPRRLHPNAPRPAASERPVTA